MNFSLVLNLREAKMFLHPLFITFLEVSEHPELIVCMFVIFARDLYKIVYECSFTSALFACVLRLWSDPKIDGNECEDGNGKEDEMLITLRPLK